MEQIIVTHLDSSTTKLQSKQNVSTITRANQKVELLGADTVEISVESATKLNFYIGDKITVIGRDYTLNTPAKEHKLSERKFVYDMVFEGVQYDLLRVSYSVNVDTTSNEIQDLSGDSLTGDLKMFLDVLLSNANRVFPGKWVLGTYPTDTETKTLTFGDSDNCLSVLQSLCSEGNYNTEFSIGIAPNGVRTLNIGATGNVFPYTFQYGKGKGLYELTREKVSSTNIVTRLSVYGSSRNINTSKYRAFRLCLPGKTKGQSYLESATGIASYGVWEQTKNFEEIYPRRTGTISALGDSELKFVDSSMDFDLNEKDGSGNTLYLIPGAAAKIHFNTGNLAGYEFEITSYNHSTKTFTLRPFTDENGYTFPSPTNAAFQFAQGDKYVILDIYLPQSYIDSAEAELQAAGQEYLNKYSQPNVMYGLTVDPLFLKDVVGAEVEANIVWVGDYIPVKDTDLDVDKSIRVKGFTRDLLKDYAYNLTIADNAVTISTISRVVSDLRGINNVVRINNLNDPARARRNYLNSQEVLSMIFDQEGDFYTEKIKPLSIDTSMLSVGAKYMQFGMAGTIFQPNYAGAKNRVVYTGGALTHYAILDSSDNPRTWTIGNGDVVLGSDDAFYIYAKCERDGVNGNILFSASQILVDSDTTYYHFLIGVINSAGENDERAIALMYGFSAINGRFIKTGRVQSADGATYFDLDSGTIQGNIRFQSGQTVEAGIQEAVDGIEIGGRNLLAFADMIQGATSGISGLFVSGTTYITSANYIQCIGASLTIGAPNSSYHVHVCFFDESQIFITSVYLLNGGAYQSTFPLTWIIPERTKFIKITVKRSDGGVVTPASVAADCRIKIELGNKPTDWTPAPEDVQANIEAVQGSVDDVSAAVDDLETYVDGAFLDGVIDSAEAIAIGQLILTVQAEADAIEATYNKLYTNPFLSGTPKTNLLNAKITFVGSVTDLIDAIDTAIADGQITAAEHTNMNAKFALYNSALASFSTAIEAANQAIQQALDQNAQGYVDNLEIGGRNLLLGTSDEWKNGSWSNWNLIPYARVDVVGGKYYTGAVELKDVVTSDGVNVGLRIFWYDADNVRKESAYGAESVANGASGMARITAKAPDDAVKAEFVIRKFASGGSTTLKYRRAKMESGSKPTDWTPAPEDVQANIDALGYLKEALNNNTDIQGGLLSTTLIKLGAVNQSGSWVEKAGINGAGTTDNTPRIYAGGTLQQAINRIAGQLTNAAKFVVTQGGKIFGMEVELFGSFRTAPPGGKHIHISHEAGAVNIHDDNGDVKTTITSEAIPSLSSLLATNSASVDATKSILLTKSNGSDSSTQYSATLKLPSTASNYKITTPPILCVCTAEDNSSGEPGIVAGAMAQVSAYLVKPDSNKILLGTVGAFVDEPLGYDNQSATIPATIFEAMAPGNYKIELIAVVNAASVYATAQASISIASPNNTLSGVSVVEVSRILRNGLFLIQDANNYAYLNPTGIKEKSQVAPDRPGVLASASVASGGTSSKAWGPKVGSSSNPSTGNYRIAHSIGHLNYNVLLTPLTAARIGYISTKATTYVDVVLTNTSGTATNTAFDYCIIGDN